ncbi:hypothetical protein DXG01_003770 [Tephrocybe rancida]|nr:hypothetical protein DXG01_003770 [Tephrocybe rancida]
MANRPVQAGMQGSPLSRSARTAVPESRKRRKRPRSVGDAPAGPREEVKRPRRGRHPSRSTQGLTSTATSDEAPNAYRVLIAPPILPDGPDGKPLDIIRALVFTLFAEPKDASDMTWSAITERDMYPWLALSNPLGVRFPDVTAVLHEAAQEAALDIDSIEKALRGAGITTSDQLVLSSDESLQSFTNIELETAHVLRNCAMQLVSSQLGFTRRFWP